MQMANKAQRGFEGGKHYVWIRRVEEESDESLEKNILLLLQLPL